VNRTETVTRTQRWSVNLLAPLNVAALVFGGRWVLALIGLHPTWPQYLWAVLVAYGTYAVMNLKYTITRTYTRTHKRTTRN